MRSQEEVSRTLRDDYAALSLALVHTAMLETIAAALGDRQTASLAGEQKDQLRDALDQLEGVLPSVLARELRESGKALPVAPERGPR
jgi:hypothetical protein